MTCLSKRRARVLDARGELDLTDVDFSGLSLNVLSHREHESQFPASAASAQFPDSEEHSLHCALRQRKAVEMECLKTNCS